MIVDSSALVAIALNEDGSDILSMALSQSRSPRISAANLLETWTVIDRRGGPRALPILEDTMSRVGLAIEPVTLAQVEIAREAYARYGRGIGHPARLNFGDCFAYALAKQTDEPLLFVGDDFIHTDLTFAVPR
ncbi:MAG: type II toxin-antitoxin system VapC family toxin [Thermomicrobiales bacterium]